MGMVIWYAKLLIITSSIIGLTHVQKLSRRLYTYILPKDHVTTLRGILIGPLEMWIGNGPMETAQAQHLRNTTVI